MADPYTEAQKRLDSERKEIIKRIRDAGLEGDVLRLMNGQCDRSLLGENYKERLDG